MELNLIGNNRRQKTFFAILIPALMFAALHKWSTLVRLGLQLILLAYVVYRKRGEILKSIIKMPLLPATVYILIVLLLIPLSTNVKESAQSWVRLVEMFVIGISIYHLCDTGTRLNTMLFYLLIAFGMAYIMDIDWYLRHLGARWKWGEIWDNPLNFDHHNTYSAICVMLLPVAVTILLNVKNIYIRLVTFIFILLNLFLLYIFQSRTAQISIVFILFVTGFLLSTMKRKIIYLILMVAIVGVLVINIRFINPRWLDNKVKTAFGRTENWENTFSLIKKRPIYGYGYGRNIFRNIYLEKFGRQNFDGILIKVAHAHNSYFDVLFSNGIIGFVAFLSLSITAFFISFREIIRRNSDWLIARAVFLSLAGAYFYFLADVYDGVQWGLTWVFLAIAMSFWKPKNNPVK